MQADHACDELLTLLRAKLPDAVKVFPGPPAEDQPLEECVYVESDQSDYEDQAIGGCGPSEDIGIDLVIEVYRESDDQQKSQKYVRDRAASLERIVTEQVLGPSDLNRTTNWTKVKTAKRTYAARGEGWGRVIELHIEATSYFSRT